MAFPENIAHYYPDSAQNQVRITAFYNDTTATIKSKGRPLGNRNLNAGETWMFEPEARMELERLEITNKSLQITSTKTITVHVVNLKGHSVQTALVIPSDILSSEYLIPPVPPINGTTRLTGQVIKQVAERSPFKLIIINAHQHNVVNITGAISKELTLQPYQVAQVWLQEEERMRVVRAQQPVAVLFGHVCTMWYNCTCGQLYSVIPPATDGEKTFYVPPFLTQNADNQTSVLLSQSDAPQVRPLSPITAVLKTAGTAILYRPGLLLPLIPESDFAACFLINSVPDSKNFAVIVVHEDEAAEVHVGSDPVNGSQWQQLHGTRYLSTQVPLASDKNVIWHSFSKMAVYLLGDKDGTAFGNPAAVISTTPGRSGGIQEVVQCFRASPSPLSGTVLLANR